MTYELQFATQQYLESFLSIREGERKLGECLTYINSWEDLINHQFQYIIIGSKDNLGVKLNNGIGGAHTNWEFFLKSFLNIQCNSFLPIEKIGILGYIDEMNDSIIHNHLEEIDSLLCEVVKKVVEYGCIPIIIGGGHNNAYPIIKGVSLALNTSLNVINLDPHADLRTTEIRHSGNGFSYALQGGYLNKYCVVGLHEGYNNEYIVNQFLNNNKQLKMITFEDIFLRNKYTFDSAISQSLCFVDHPNIGCELDIDAIENILSSAMTPVGIHSREALQYLYRMGQAKVKYLHIAEAVAIREDGVTQPTIGKLLSYLLQGFIKGLEN